MCEYCKGEWINDKDLFTLDMKFGLLGEWVLSACVVKPNDKKDRWYIRSNLADCHGKMTCLGERRIHYCPMCGRKLGGEEC